MNQLNLTIVPGQDGGIIIYEFIDGAEQVPVFGGDLDATTKYLSNRMSKVVATGDQVKAKPAKSDSTTGVMLLKSKAPKSESYAPSKSMTELLEQLPAE